MPWIEQRTWEPKDMVSAGRLNTLVRDDWKMLRYRPAFRAHSTADQEPDAYEDSFRTNIDTIDYDLELITFGDGYFDTVLGTYVTSRKGVYAFGAQLQMSPSDENGMLQLVMFNDTTGVAVGRQTTLIAPTGSATATVTVGLNTMIGCRVNDAVRVNFAFHNVFDPGYYVPYVTDFSAVMWGHWIKDWNERSQPWLSLV